MAKKNTKKINRKNSYVAAATIIGGLVILAFFMLYSITKGAAKIPLETVWDAIFNFEADNRHHLIVVDLRLPRVISSALIGAAFAVAGAVMQGTTRNPLADSGLLGINAGAGFALSLCFAFFPGMGHLKIMLACFMGALLGSTLVYGVAALRRGGATPVRLVLAGAAVGALLSSVSSGISIYFRIQKDILFWTMGTVAKSDWRQVALIAPWILGAIALAIILSRSISLLSIGEDVAKGLGLNTKMVYFFSTIIVLILAGVSVSVVGSVGFIGLIIPHLSRLIVGVDYRLIIPTSAVLGGLLVVLADLAARTLNPPYETPLGVFLAVIGVPFFLYLANKKRGVVK